MEISSTYIISQVFLIFNYIFLLLTYYTENRKKIFIFNTISLISESIGFLLLGAFSGCAMMILAFLRNILIRYNERLSNIKFQNFSFVILCLAIIASSFITYDGLYSILPGIAGVIYLYSLRQKSIKTYKILGIPVELCWILYSVCIHSIMGIIGDICILAYIIYNLFQSKYKKQ